MINITSSLLLKFDNNVTYLEGRLDSDIYSEFKKELGYYPEEANYIVRTVQAREEMKERLGLKSSQFKKDWDGLITTVCYNKKFCRCFSPKGGTHFPTGLLYSARKFLQEKGLDVKIQDIRSCPNRNVGSLQMTSLYESRPYQLQVVEDSIKKNRGIIKMATGGGKTACICKLVADIGVFPLVIYVTSIDLLYQMKKELEKFISKNGEKIEVGIIGDGKKDIKDITVMTIQTAVIALGGTYKKYDDEERKQQIEKFYKEDNEIKDTIKNARLIICDEVQHWASETCQMISDASDKAYYRYGLSGTPYRDLNDDILIEGCFGRMISNINASYLIDHGYLVAPHIYFIDIHHKMKWSGYPKVYKYGIVENELRNEYIKSVCEMLTDDNRNILILCKQISHGEILQSMIPNSIFLHGVHSAKQRGEHLEKMRQKEAGVTISSSIFDEGIDVSALDALVLAGSGRSSTRALQRIGRILRPYPNKKDAIVIDFMDNYKYLKQHSLKREKIYKTEPKFEIERLKI